MIPTTMVYDLETIPDCDLGRKLLDMPGASDTDVALALKLKRLEKTQGSSDFLPHYMQRIVAISVVVANSAWVKVWSLGEENSDEKTLIERFFAGIDKYSPILVSWNGCGFDLPVLHYRALLHGIPGTRYWETGETDKEFRWNNYLSRYHHRHTDLMDVLSGYQTRAFAPLNEIALMLDLPGKMGMDGHQVFEKFENNDIESIRNYCETDVLNTYLVYLRFLLIKGVLNSENYDEEIGRVKQFLQNAQKPHFLEFLEHWSGQKEIKNNI